MREINVGGETRTVDCNAYTVILYSNFKGGADLKNVLSDFGRGADLAALPMNTLLEVLYVMEKTVNAKVGSFDGWLRALPVEALDLTDTQESWVIEVIDLLTTTFFRQSLKANLVATIREEEPAAAE